jgi:membrane protein implicated in regulation of membrane protease activity
MFAWLAALGPWNWLILGGLLLALEIMAPGVYLLWIGIAALLTGALSFQIGDAAWWSWQVQLIVFVVLALVSTLAGRYFFGADRGGETDQPLLNRREQQLIGQVSTLEEPIRDGQGRVRLGDTLWLVRGPELPAGTRVRVVSAQDGHLKVEAVE